MRSQLTLSGSKLKIPRRVKPETTEEKDLWGYKVLTGTGSPFNPEWKLHAVTPFRMEALEEAHWLKNKRFPVRAKVEPVYRGDPEVKLREKYRIPPYLTIPSEALVKLALLKRGVEPDMMRGLK